MSTKASNVRFKHVLDNGLDVVTRTPKASTEIAYGDLLIESSNTVDIFAAVGNNTVFTGLARDFSLSTETTPVKVALRGVCWIDVAAAAYAFGDALKYSAGSHTADWVLTAASSGADAIMNFFEEGRTLSAQGEAICYWDMRVQGVGIGSTALFEPAAV